MEEDWLCSLLDAQGLPIGVMAHGNMHGGLAGPAKGRSKRNGGGSYITPPNMRKVDATAAVPAPIRAVAVVATKVVQPEEDLQLKEVPTEPAPHLFMQAPTIAQPTPPEMMPTWDHTTSCVPAGAAWVTTVPPPRREKRARKVCPRAPTGRAPGRPRAAHCVFFAPP